VEEKSTKPGETVTFNLDIFNKWPDVANIQIEIKSIPTSSWNANPIGYSGSDDLDPYQTFNQAKVQVKPHISARGGNIYPVEFVVHVLQAPDNSMDVTITLKVEITVEYKFTLKMHSDTFVIPISLSKQLDPAILLTNDATAMDAFSITYTIIYEPIAHKEWEITISHTDQLIQIPGGAQNQY